MGAKKAEYFKKEEKTYPIEVTIDQELGNIQNSAALL